jgi:hypothetical protein
VKPQNIHKKEQGGYPGGSRQANDEKELVNIFIPKKNGFIHKNEKKFIFFAIGGFCVIVSL